ncbi:Receptor activity-modifying protein 1 [Galemys pyrenaicus]|uniref:Receptor activity-modifying protein 1 n=1 Tax=Galemys pyrenaicus TaxID=202257 RepID=A0A8J5ZWW8_GALPY|nr:Receptor activity-modifying protein 1 [Galemys pyrenaicus]
MPRSRAPGLLATVGTGRHCSPWRPTTARPRRSYGELRACTQRVAEKLHCSWPGPALDRFFVAVHRRYFKACPASGRALRDPPGSVLRPFVAVPVLVTLLVAALVVWRSKRTEGVV